MEAQSGLLFAIDYVKFVSKNLNQKLLFSKLKLKKNWAVFELRFITPKHLFSENSLFVRHYFLLNSHSLQQQRLRRRN